MFLLLASRAEAADCPSVAGPSARSAWRAELVGSTPVRRRLARASTARTSPRSAGALLVLGAAREQDGRCWVRVRLPARPNGAAGWVEVSRVELRATRWRIEVRLAQRRVNVLRDGRVVRRFKVVVGAPATPTPTGLFAVTGAWRSPPDAFLGAWVLALTAHSDTLQRYDGGDGRVALHGRGGASLRDPLGTARSHGCVRLDNAAIRWLVRTVGATRLPGTPVRIR
jgi:hypothetical protein